jgi:hypothetical protein
MKYFIDTEFLEGTQKQRGWFGITIKNWLLIFSAAFMTLAVLLATYNAFYLQWDANVVRLSVVYIIICLYLMRLQQRKWETPPTIDLISIAVVDEREDELYLISKEFNIYEAWFRYEIKEVGDARNMYAIKEYWIRENVLMPIYWRLFCLEYPETAKAAYGGDVNYKNDYNNFAGDHMAHSFGEFKFLVEKHGLSREEIKAQLEDFCNAEFPEFYGYYADYDWVALCWTFGKMMALPKNFPMYCRDLKQIFDDKAKAYFKDRTLSENIGYIKNRDDYPKQEGLVHDALADAYWNRELYWFLKTI